MEETTVVNSVSFPVGARHDWWAWLSPFCTYYDYKNGHFIYVLSIPGPYKGD